MIVTATFPLSKTNEVKTVLLTFVKRKYITDLCLSIRHLIFYTVGHNITSSTNGLFLKIYHI